MSAVLFVGSLYLLAVAAASLCAQEQEKEKQDEVAQPSLTVHTTLVMVPDAGHDQVRKSHL